MYDNETNWVSQTLLYYKDEKYASDGTLRVSIYTNTKDYKSFNPPTFGINISNQFQRNYNLSLIEASDLAESFKHAFKKSGSLFQEKSQIIKQNKTIQFIIEFTTSQNEDLIVKLMLKMGDTDYTICIIPASIFQIFANRIKYFVDKYDDICMRQYQVALQGDLTEALKQLPGLIKGMPSQILPANYLDRSAPPEEEVKKTEMGIEDLDKFLGPDMKNIRVAELDKEKEVPVTDVDSPFVEHFIKNDLRNLETILNNTSSIEEIGLKMMQDMKLNADGFSMLPGIEDEELKSLLYISKLLINTIEISWTKFETPIPSSISILKYKAKDNVQPENLELAYDLLLFGGYIRSVRRRLEDKIGDANENKALFHLKFRCYLDPFCYSFLEKADKTKLTSIIVNRFKYYDKLEVFKDYKNALKLYNCIEVTEADIISYVNEVSEKVIGKSLFILDLHDTLQKQNNFRIGSKSNFTKEQIINEIVPLEISESLGQDTSGIEVSDEIKNFFKSRGKVEKKVEKKNHLSRVIGTLKNDIPEKYREEFIEWIYKFDNKNFIFDDKFPYSEFGDDIIKALYVWKPENDSRIASSLKYYQTQIENEVMEKQYILSLDEEVKEKDVEVDFSNINWDE